MYTFAKHFPGLAALVASVALAGQPVTGPAPARPNPSDPAASVAPKPYESFLVPKPAESADDGSPADHWIEANRTVASFDSMSLTMGGSNAGDGRGAGEEQMSSKASTGKDPHAGHSMSTAQRADPHAGHAMPMDMPAKPAAKREPAPSVAGAGVHRADDKPARSTDTQASPARGTKDPHAGHNMAPAATDPHAAHSDKERK
jgi:hypothetical protein